MSTATLTQPATAAAPNGLSHSWRDSVLKAVFVLTNCDDRLFPKPAPATPFADLEHVLDLVDPNRNAYRLLTPEQLALGGWSGQRKPSATPVSRSVRGCLSARTAP